LRWTRSEAYQLQPLRTLYGSQPDFEARLKHLLHARCKERKVELKDLELQRNLAPDWPQSEKMWTMFSTWTPLRKI
jgi:hypothetical protein